MSIDIDTSLALIRSPISITAYMYMWTLEEMISSSNMQ